MPETLYLDNTKRKLFRQCKMKYFISCIKGLQSNYGSTAIRYGVTWHGIQEGYYTWVVSHGWPQDNSQSMAALIAGLDSGKLKWDKESNTKIYHEDYKTFNTAADAFSLYLDKFVEDKQFMKIISTETTFECPIEPENRAEDKVLSKLPPIVFTGRIDLLVELDHMIWLQDFKTTGWILDKVISQANRSPQLIGYSYASNRVFNFQVNGCLASFAYIGVNKSKKTGDYGDTRYDFRRSPQIYTEGDIVSWKISFIDTCREIDQCTKENLWVESFDACYQYGQCTYLKLCQQHVPFDDLNTEGFHVEFWDVLDNDEVEI